MIHTLPGNEDGVNVEAAAVEKIAVTGEKYIKMRVVERGSGETMACGTGGPTEYVFEGYFDIPIASFYNGTR